MLIFRVSPIQCLYKICWCFEVRTLGEIFAPSSPLQRILGALSSLEIVNLPRQWNRTVPPRPDEPFFTSYGVLGSNTAAQTCSPLASTRSRIRGSHSIFGLRSPNDLWFVPGIRPWFQRGLVWVLSSGPRSGIERWGRSSRLQHHQQTMVSITQKMVEADCTMINPLKLPETFNSPDGLKIRSIYSSP